MHKRCYLVVWKKHWFDWVCMLYCIRRWPNGTPTWPKRRSPPRQGFRRPAEALLQQVRNPEKSRGFKGTALTRVVPFLDAKLPLLWQSSVFPICCGVLILTLMTRFLSLRPTGFIISVCCEVVYLGYIPRIIDEQTFERIHVAGINTATLIAIPAPTATRTKKPQPSQQLHRTFPGVFPMFFRRRSVDSRPSHPLW